MRTEVVEYQGDGWAARLTVSEANNRIQIRRDRLVDEGRRAVDEDDDRRILRIYSYPPVCAAVVESSGLPWAWPPDFETFYESMPSALTAKLEEAIYRLNPHWLPAAPEGTEDPKAPAQDSTSGSTTA
jgi:hypothetical protein